MIRKHRSILQIGTKKETDTPYGSSSFVWLVLKQAVGSGLLADLLFHFVINVLRLKGSNSTCCCSSSEQLSVTILQPSLTLGWGGEPLTQRFILWTVFIASPSCK